MTYAALAAALVACVAAVLLVGGHSSAQAKGSIPARAIKVGSGRLGSHTSWSIWLYGRQDSGSCWVTLAKEDGLANANTSCGFSVPKRYWELAAEGSAGNMRKSMLFFLTRRNLDHLRVQLVTPKRSRWIAFRVKRLTQSESKRAELPTNFGYSGHSFRGSIGCIRTVDSFDRDGQLANKAHLHGC